MRAVVYSLLAITLITCIYSCQKGSVTEYNFTQITFTDSLGNEAEVDTTDWTYDNSWTGGEIKLVSYIDSLKATDSMPGFIKISPAYPNPTKGTIIMNINFERACKMKAVLVNQNFEILFYQSNLVSSGPGIAYYDLRGLTAIDKNNYYRLYYGIFNSKDSLYYKGHGDLLIQ